MLKAPVRWTGAFSVKGLKSGDANLLSLGSLGALGDLEFDRLVLVERLVAIGIDRGVVNENVRTAISLLDEAEAFFCVEPLNGALCHGA